MTETRAEKAQRLVDEGRVTIGQKTSSFTQAVVQGKDGRYRTTIYVNGTFWCTCKWGDFHNYTDDLCAHALAVKLATEKENEPCP